MIRYKKSTQLWLSLISSLLLATLSACGSTGHYDKDVEFLAMVGANKIPGVQLQTDRTTYNLGQGLAYVVINKTVEPLFFKDQSLGIQIYQYDEIQRDWQRINTTLKVGFPKETQVLPLRIENDLPTYGFGPGQIDAKGKIRLAAFGWTDPTNPEKSGFVVWKDIEIR